MIYGSLAKQYGNNTYKPMSESDSIIKYLLREQNNYEVILNESYIDDKERLIVESKIQVIQEIAMGAIVAAIIAVITAIITLIVALGKSMGSSANNLKKVIKESEKKNEDSLKNMSEKIDKEVNKNNEDNRKKEILYEFQKSLKHDCTKNDFTGKEIQKMADEIYGEFDEDEYLDELSMVDFSTIVNPDGLKEINNQLRISLDPKNDKELETAEIYIKAYLDEKKPGAILNSLFNKWYTTKFGPYDVFVGRKTAVDNLMNVYDYYLEDRDKVIFNPKYYFNEIEKLNKTAQSNISKLKTQLEETKSLLNKYKDIKYNELQSYTGDDESRKKQIQKDMLQLSRTSTNMIKDAITAWATIEGKRFNLMKRIYSNSAKVINREYRKKIYKDFSDKYGSEFTDQVKLNEYEKEV